MDFAYIFSIVLLVLGFGFVIFWHELGHFLAAKWAGVKVEQFAVGFGTAIFSWRKGVGIRSGSTAPEMKKLIAQRWEQKRASESQFKEHLEPTPQIEDAIARELGLGETEYRLNWLPLGGYVKMLGQDDMNPNAQVDDPRAYNMQTIPKRMVIVSAGVIMNIILAAVGFFILFLYGFNVPPPIVGVVQPLSPAQIAGIEVGDKIISMDGKPQLDWTKIPLNVALLPDDRDIPIVVERPSDHQQHTLTIRASRAESGSHGMLALGVMSTVELRGLDPAKLPKDAVFDPTMNPKSFAQVAPGDEIVAIEGKSVDPKTDYWKLDRAVQQANGYPVEVSVKKPDGQIEKQMITSNLLTGFGQDEVELAGMTPRSAVEGIVGENSLMKGKLLPGDVITSLRVVAANDRYDNPTRAMITEKVNRAGEQNDKVTFTVLRDGKSVTTEPIVPTLKNEQKHWSVGIALDYDLDHPVVGDVQTDSAADRAGVQRGAVISSLNNQPVKTWRDVQRILKSATPDSTIKLVASVPDVAEPKTFELPISRADVSQAAAYLYEPDLRLRELIVPRQTNNPLRAAAWGIGETRDLIVQFYITLKRMVQRSVPASNLMGPVGIATVGAKFANKGADWLIWFLSMISANLAVVNFLPIPIVDGGLFMFLIIEKLQGKPLSARTQSIAQVVGLALILSVFIFVTYQDFTR